MKTLRCGLLAGWLLCGCEAGSGDGLDDQGRPPTPVENPDVSAGPTLAQLQKEIFGTICSACHTGANAPQGLRLDSEQNAYESLVGQPAREAPALLRVAPGAPDASYLIHKVEGRANIIGARMPRGEAALSPEQIGLVRDWIDNGAPRTGAGTAAARVVLAGIEATASQWRWHLRFSRPLQRQTFDAAAVQVYLHDSGGPWLMPDRDLEIHLQGRNLTIGIPYPDAPPAAVELRLNDPHHTAILDAQGQVVDGDGDRREGGVYEQTLRF